LGDPALGWAQRRGGPRVGRGRPRGRYLAGHRPRGQQHQPRGGLRRRHGGVHRDRNLPGLRQLVHVDEGAGMGHLRLRDGLQVPPGAAFPRQINRASQLL
ncbi:unnamed protein product, partial [Ectocarpus fasciculatus]